MQKLPIQPNEHSIMNSIIDLLRYENYYVWRNNVGAAPYISKTGKKQWVRFGQPGFSDIFAIQPKTGKMVCIEVKTPKTRNSASAAQIDFLQRVNEQGAIGFIATCPEEVAEKLGIKGLL